MSDTYPTLSPFSTSGPSVRILAEYGLIKMLEAQVIHQNTSKGTIYGVNKYERWLKRRGKTCTFYTVLANELNILLRKFYAEVKPIVNLANRVLCRPAL